MNKKVIIPILICSFILSGCSFTKYFTISSIETVVLYEEEEAVPKGDVASGKYADLMLPSYIVDLWVTRDGVLNTETRTLVSSDSNSAVYYPRCSAGDTLGNWIKSSNCAFTFKQKRDNKEKPNELYVETYSVKNYGSANTFRDYLSVMSALTQYYGECTVELYKNGNSVVSISEMQQTMETEEIIEQLEQNFSNGTLALSAQWIDKAYNITVNFNSPSDCSVVYTLNI